MRILVVHNRYQLRGGEDQSVQARIGLLREWGHVIDTFIESNARVSELGRLGTARRTIWSAEAYAALRIVLKQSHYDVMDVHNTFPLISPAAYYAARAAGVPVVQTLHNYRLLCPSATLYRAGRTCEDCLGRALAWPGVLHGCYRGSRLGSAVVAGMLAVHRRLGTWTHLVDVYVAPSKFARQKFIEGGLAAERIAIAPNFIHPDPGYGDHSGEYALFVGRLSPEKGIDTLLAAWSRIGDKIRLRIAGDGPLAPRVAKTAASGRGVEWLGQRTSTEVAELMDGATLLVVPSQCYETFGVVAAEAFARGTPVVASRIGALAEVVQDGQGLLVPPGDAIALAERVEWAWSRRNELARRGQAGRRAFELRYAARPAGEALLTAYRAAVVRHRG